MNESVPLWVVLAFLVLVVLIAIGTDRVLG